MSDRLLSRLADHLGLSESEVAPILKALLKQVRKRAGNSSGVQIPNLGTFSTDAEGTLQFTPDDALVEAVNEDYAGLEEEPAPEPARAPDTSTALAEPSAFRTSPPTSKPSPSKQTKEGAEKSTAASSTPSDTEADADDATEELPAAGGSDTGSLWPSESNKPKTSDDADQEEDDAGDSDAPDSDFWSQDREWDLSSVAFGDEPDEDLDLDEDDDASARSDDATPAASPVETSDTADDAAPVSPADGDADGESDPAPSQERTGWRTTAGVLFLLAAFIGGWIVLGEQGTVPAPGTVAEQVRASFSGSEAGASSDAEDATADSRDVGASDTDTAPSDSDASDADASEDDDAPSNNDEASDTDGNAESSDDAAEEDAPDPSDEAPSIQPDEGGWTLVVASRTSETEAEELQSIFTSSLQEDGLPVDILPSDGSDGTTRYRVVVGQFDSQAEAQDAQEAYSDVVPEDAWALQL